MADWHPLDGNMRAADRYYDRPSPAEIGDACRACGEGWMIEQEDDDGVVIEDAPLACNDCGEVDRG